MPRIPAIAAALLALSACASPRSRVETALIDAGVRAPMAACMAKRMADRLSIAQLQKLSRARGAPGEKIRDLSVGELLSRVQRIGDPEVISVVTAAGAACALAG